MKKKLHSLILLFLSFLIIPACKVAQYRKSSLQKIDSYSLKKDRIELQAKELSENDISDIFGKNSRGRLTKNRCIHISVKNNADSCVVLDPQNIEIPQVTIEASPGTLAPSTSKWHFYNCSIKKEMEDKMISEQIILYPKQQFDGLIFVKKNDLKNKKRFNITLCDKEDRSKEYCFFIDTDLI